MSAPPAIPRALSAWSKAIQARIAAVRGSSSATMLMTVDFSDRAARKYRP
jgi:hypothetical protein